jgi:hypothetical protein
MQRDVWQRRAEAESQAMAANVAGRNGIQNAAGWKIIAAVLLLAGIAIGLYLAIAPRHYVGRVSWIGPEHTRQMKLIEGGEVLDFDDAATRVSIDGADALLPPGPLPAYFETATVNVYWAPYWIKHGGSSGQVVTVVVTR